MWLRCVLGKRIRLASSGYWLELAEKGKDRFGDRFADVKANTNDPDKLGVGLSSEWRPEPLRIDFIKKDTSDRPSVKLLEVDGFDRAVSRPLIEFAIDNRMLLLGKAAKEIQGRFEPKRNPGKTMNSLFLHGPNFSSFELIHREASMDWFLNGFEIYESLLLPKLLEKYQSLTAE